MNFKNHHIERLAVMYPNVFVLWCKINTRLSFLLQTKCNICSEEMCNEEENKLLLSLYNLGGAEVVNKYIINNG